MKLNRKWMLVIALVLSLTMATAGTLAYLTDRDTVENTFTMGNVDIEVEEEFVPDSPMYPGVEVEKKAGITNTHATEPAYVWMVVSVPTALDPHLDLKWANEGAVEKLGADAVHDGYVSYLVKHEGALAPNESTGNILLGVELDDNVDYQNGSYGYVTDGTFYPVEGLDDVSIFVDGFAIQTEKFADVDEAYDAYVGQWGELGNGGESGANGGEEEEPTGTAVATADELVDALAAGGEFYLANDIELTSPATVPAGVTTTLNLNGKTISYESTTQGEAMITNRGNLTINGDGEIYYNYTGAADPNYGKGNYTISNGGTLTINGGKIHIANLRSHAKYPIDNNSTSGDAVLVINGGHLYNYNTCAIRQFCNSTTNKNSVTINGGLIEGYCAIWMQNPGSKTVNGDLTITGGEVRTTAAAYVNGTSELKDVSSRIYSTCDGDGGAWSADSFVSITGGTINENINFSEEAPANVTISGATTNGSVK